MPVNEAQPDPSRTILLIEDSPTIRAFLRGLLRSELPGTLVVEATDGRTALREMTRTRADLIVTDLQMPGMDGRSFLATLRANPLLRKKSVLVLSGEDLGPLRELYAGESNLRFLNKPAGSEQILAEVRALFGAAPQPLA